MRRSAGTSVYCHGPLIITRRTRAALAATLTFVHDLSHEPGQGFTETVIYLRADGVRFLESFGPKEDSDAPQVPHRGSPSGDRREHRCGGWERRPGDASQTLIRSVALDPAAARSTVATRR